MCDIIVLFFAVVRLNESHAVKYGLCLNMEEKYRGLKKQLSVLCGVPACRLLLVDVYGTLVRVGVVASPYPFCFTDRLKCLFQSRFG